MKHTLIICTLLAFMFAGTAQDTIVLYLDNQYELIQQDSASIIREVIVADSRYYITDKSADGNMRNYIELKSLDPRIADGPARSYGENNSLYAKGNYKNGELHGDWIYFDKNGTADTVTYRHFDLGKQNPKAKFYTSNRKTKILGAEIIDSLRAFTYHNFHIPPRVKDMTSYIEFSYRMTVGTNGRIIFHYNPHENYHTDIEKEFSRVIDMFRYHHDYKKPFNIEVEFQVGDKSGEQELLNENDTSVFLLVDEMPRFRDDEWGLEFQLWVLNQMKLTDKNINCFGTMHIRFIVEKDGTVSDVSISKGLENCDWDYEDLIHIVKNSPPWTPGRQKGIPVRVRQVIPIKI